MSSIDYARRAMFGLLRAWRRRRLRRRLLPESWLPILAEHAKFFTALEPEVRRLFLQRLKVFVWEKYWIEAGGMEITEEVKVAVSSAAVRLALHQDESIYNGLTEIVVYPSHYKHPEREGSAILGEAHAWGVVVLSWDATKSGFADPNDGHDTAAHEFAHVLDRASGQFNGTPELRASEHYRPWARVMTHHFEALREGKKRQRRILRDYGATNEAEFFAVATESFFEKPVAMREQTPSLYAELRQFYGFDPASSE